MKRIGKWQAKILERAKRGEIFSPMREIPRNFRRWEKDYMFSLCNLIHNTPELKFIRGGRGGKYFVKWEGELSAEASERQAKALERLYNPERRPDRPIQRNITLRPSASSGFGINRINRNRSGVARAQDELPDQTRNSYAYMDYLNWRDTGVPPVTVNRFDRIENVTLSPEIIGEPYTHMIVVQGWSNGSITTERIPCIGSTNTTHWSRVRTNGQPIFDDDDEED